MFFRPILGAHIRPVFYTCVQNNKTLRPSIKLGREQFQLSLDVHEYNKDEIRVRAHPEYVVIEGKQEKTTQQGYILRQFIRKFKLPDGCIPGKIESRLSPEGILTITAPRSFSDSSTPSDAVMVPIAYGASDKEKLKKLEEPKPPQPPCVPPIPPTPPNPCANYPKAHPKEK